MKLFRKTDCAEVAAGEPICTAERISIFDTDYPLDKSDWYQVFSASMGRTVAPQDALAQLAGHLSWNVDFSAQTFSFGADEYVFPVQFIGSESNVSDTWKWGWDNINNFDEGLIELAKEAKRFGDEWGLEPLEIDGFCLDETFCGKSMAIVACAISKKKYCFYRGPHDKGSILMGLSGLPEGIFAPVDKGRFIELAMACIQSEDVDHRIFAESFLMWNGTKYRWQGNTVVALFDKEVYIEYEKVEGSEDFWRIASVKTEM